MLSRLGSFSYLKPYLNRVEASIRRSRAKRNVGGKVFRFKETDAKELSKSLSNKTFKLTGLYPKEIEKKEKGKFRGLLIPIPIDRVVHKAMLNVLKPNYLDYLGKTPSYGVQKYHGMHDALRDVCFEIFDKQYKYILVADVKKFFDKINRDMLSQELYAHISNDTSINFLIADVLNVHFKYPPEHKDIFPDEYFGIPQGCALSPLFADIYLKKFDIEMENGGYKIYRYVDDFVLLGRNKKYLYNGFRKARKILRTLKLELHPYNSDKCKSVSLTEHPTFLGIEIGPGGSRRPSKKKMYEFNQKIGDMVTELQYPKKRHSITKSLNYKIMGWKSAYRICDKSSLTVHRDALNSTVDRGLERLKMQNRISENERSMLRRIIRRF